MPPASALTLRPLSSRMLSLICCGGPGFTLFTACCPRRTPSRLWADPCSKAGKARRKGSLEIWAWCSWMQLCSALSCGAPSCSTRCGYTGKVSELLKSHAEDGARMAKYNRKCTHFGNHASQTRRLPRSHGVLWVPAAVRRAGAAPHQEARQELHCEGREASKSITQRGVDLPSRDWRGGGGGGGGFITPAADLSAAKLTEK